MMLPRDSVNDLTREDTMATDVSIRVLSWKEAAGFVHLWPTHRISLLDPDDAALAAVSPRPDLVTIEMEVADVTDPTHPHAATAGDVQRLVEVGAHLPSGSRVLIHCRGGIGRSPAAAMIVLVAAGRSPEQALEQVLQVRRQARPNPWLLLLADHQRRVPRSGLFPVWLAWAHRQEFFHPVPNRVVRDGLAGRLDWDEQIELVKAQTHKQRGVSHGRHRRA